jgi:hypothetical protein
MTIGDRDMQDNSAAQVTYWENQERIYKRSYVSIALLCINVIAFLLSNTVMLWMYEKGAMVKSNFVDLDDGRHYFDAQGHMVKGTTMVRWFVKYTFDENGVLIK